MWFSSRAPRQAQSAVRTTPRTAQGHRHAREASPGQVYRNRITDPTCSAGPARNAGINSTPSGMEEAVSALLGVPVCQLEPSSALFNWCLWCIPAVLIVGPLWFTYLSLIHISEPTRQAEISYAVFCLKKKKKKLKNKKKKKKKKNKKNSNKKNKNNN